jgi:hypothetical protein
MELLEQEKGALMDVASAVTGRVAPPAPPADERAARRSMQRQIARLERDLADAFVTAYPMGGLVQTQDAVRRDARILTLGELERVRDELAERLQAARVTIASRAEIQAARRVALERMLLDPASHRYERVSCRDLGEQGCGVWHVRPRLGLIGMLMGWWQVKLSSGCPLPGAAVLAAAR